VACFWQFRASVEDFQVAVIREEAMPLLAGSLTELATLARPRLYTRSVCKNRTLENDKGTKRFEKSLIQYIDRENEADGNRWSRGK
jgi:hypothetical protein